jgi:hypothetical protein
MSKRKSNSQKKEIIWNVINSLLAGTLVLLGALSTGNISMESMCLATITALIVAISQFKDYWTKEQKEYRNKAFMFIHF